MQFGHNRDGKRDRPIVVYGVLADAAGRPLTVQAYAVQHGGSRYRIRWRRCGIGSA